MAEGTRGRTVDGWPHAGIRINFSSVVAGFLLCRPAGVLRGAPPFDVGPLVTGLTC